MHSVVRSEWLPRDAHAHCTDSIRYPGVLYRQNSTTVGLGRPVPRLPTAVRVGAASLSLWTPSCHPPPPPCCTVFAPSSQLIHHNAVPLTIRPSPFSLPSLLPFVSLIVLSSVQQAPHSR